MVAHPYPVASLRCDAGFGSVAKKSSSQRLSCHVNSGLTSPMSRWSRLSGFLRTNKAKDFRWNTRFRSKTTYSTPVWLDWTIFWTLGNFLKPLKTINLSNSLTFLGNFWKCVKIYLFLVKSFLGNFYRHFSIFSGHPALQKLPKTVEDLDQLIVTKGFKMLPKVQLIAQSGHTGSELSVIMYLPTTHKTLTKPKMCWGILFEQT